MFLNEENQEFVREILSDMQDDVVLTYFTQKLECMYCKETHELLRELVALSDQLTLKSHNYIEDQALADQMGVKQIPAIIISRKQNSNHRIKFYGIPSGYEFSSLLEDIVDVSKNNPGFDEDFLQEVRKIDKPVHIQVFVTPTCPYCPSAVRTAHRLAIANPNISADMVEATEFPHLAQKYYIRGVPKSVINEKWSLEGAVPERAFLDKIKESIQ